MDAAGFCDPADFVKMSHSWDSTHLKRGRNLLNSCFSSSGKNPKKSVLVRLFSVCNRVLPALHTKHSALKRGNILNLEKQPL